MDSRAIGALKIKIGFGALYTILIIRNPPKIVLVITRALVPPTKAYPHDPGARISALQIKALLHATIEELADGGVVCQHEAIHLAGLRVLGV